MAFTQSNVRSACEMDNVQVIVRAASPGLAVPESWTQRILVCTRNPKLESMS